MPLMDKLFTLNHFGFLSVTGKDALKFLQGYTTCDLNELDSSRSLMGAICNIQGRMVANFRVAPYEGGFLLRLNAKLIPVVEAFLKKYIVFSKAKLENLSSSLICYGSLESEPNYPKTHLQFTQNQGDWIICVDGSSHRFEIWSNKQRPSNDDLQVWFKKEIDSGYAWIDEKSESEYLPQMFNLHNLEGISFEKGCYLGQEIVARMQFRGKLKKTLYSGESQGTFQIGDMLFTEDGKPVGKIVAAAKFHFLAVIQAKSETNLQLRLSDRAEVSVRDLASITPE